jgi:glutathione S-transferase
VTECAAICCYLADAFPEAGLAPRPEDRLRGPYYRWLFFAAGPLEAAAANQAMGFEVPPERKAMVGYGSLADVLATLETALSGRSYLVGDRFSAADLYVGAHLGWGMTFGTLDRRPVFERYVERLHNRPAAIRAREIDDALAPKDGQPAPG